MTVPVDFTHKPVAKKIAAVATQDGKILLLSEATKTWLNLPGGKVEGDETWTHCLHRELQEELGVKARELEWWGGWTGPGRDAKDPWSAVLVHVHLQSEPKPLAEIQGVHWLTHDQALAQELAPSARIAVQLARQKKLI